MEKEESTSGIFGMFGESISSIYELITSDIKMRISSEIEFFGKRINHHARLMEKRFMRSFISASLLILAGVFFSIAVVYFMIDFLGIPRSLSFFIAFIIFLAVALIVKNLGGGENGK